MIDDDPNVRDLTTRTLGKEGYRVEGARDGKEGLAKARELCPAVITLDVMMPGLDGWEVLAALKEDSRTSGIPVIMLTIVDEQQIGFSLGADDYLTKPVDWERLSAAVVRHGAGVGEDVLIVEDDAVIRELLTRILRKDGWSVRVAENGRVGLAEVEASTPAVVLLDLMMPEVDGFGFVERLRQLPGAAEVPVIVLTAKDITVEDRRRLNGEVSRILQKTTLSPDELISEIRKLANQSSTHAL